MKPRTSRRLSLLNPLPPFGVGAADTESLQSYFFRLALSHCITAPALKQKICDLMDWRQPTKYHSSDLNLNGVGHAAVQWSSALSELTGVARLDLLTLISWRDVIAIKGLTCSTSYWCPLCFSLDRQEGREPYFRLSWHISSANACAKHSVYLLSSCLRCGRPNACSSSAYVVAGWCCFCGSFLGDAVNVTPATVGDLWRAREIGKLVAMSPALRSAPTRAIMIEGLVSIIARLDHGMPTLFARRIGLNKTTVHYWLKEGGTPGMPALLRIAAHAGVALPALLTGDVTDAHLAATNSLESELIPPKRKRAPARAIDAEKISAQLDRLISTGRGLSVSEAARQLNVHPRQLYDIANDRAKKIGEAWRRERKERAHRNRERAAALIEAAVLDILAEGKGPTLRELRSRIPKEVLGSVREIFVLLEEAKAKVSRR
ncbi:TniQ family protein [Paraburkholderia bannensis]|uniref:TniQ family protein n=1 Tax=Paraburkholderia bannensis TaxID=765414 RepID=UPI002AB11598|nr:TniQ family protein [Paraburkholderia bannensis]